MSRFGRVDFVFFCHLSISVVLRGYLIWFSMLSPIKHEMRRACVCESSAFEQQKKVGKVMSIEEHQDAGAKALLIRPPHVERHFSASAARVARCCAAWPRSSPPRTKGKHHWRR